MARKQFPLAVVIEAVDKLSAPMRRINNRIKDATKPVRKLANSFKTLARESGLTKVAGLIGNIAKRLAVATVAAAGLAAKLVFDFARAGDNIAKTAKRLGVGVEWLQEMRFAADRSGIAVATFDMAIQRMGRRVGQLAATGSGEAAIAMEMLGINIFGANGELRTMENLLPEVADRLGRVKDETTRNFIAMKLFDSEGVKMVQLLEEGSAGMSKLQARARQLGLVLSEADAKAAEGFNDSLLDLKSSLMGARNIIGGALMPTLKALTDRLTALIIDNLPAIKKFGESLAGIFSTKNLKKFKSEWADAKRIFNKIGEAFVWIHEKVGIVKASFIALGALIAAMFLPALIAIGTALAPLVVAAAPFVAIGAAVVAAGIGIAEVVRLTVEWIKKLDILGKMREKIDGIRKSFDDAIGGAKDKLSGIAGNVKSFFGFDDAPEPTQSSITSETVNRGRTEVAIRGDFSGVPSGARIEMDAPRGADTSLDVGFAMAGAN